MSSRPGLDLEDFLMWNYDLVVEGLEDANSAVQMTEVLGHPSRRVRLTAKEFAPILQAAEDHRDDVERRLLDYDEDEQSWRSYAGSVDWLPKEVEDEIDKLLKELAASKASPSKGRHWASDLPPGDVFGVCGSN